MILEKLKQVVNWAHDKGIPIPLLRDVKHNKPSISFTMMVVSFFVCLVGLLTKFNDSYADIDMSQALMLFGLCASLYFGRQAQINSKAKTIDLTGVKEESENTEEKEIE